MPETICLECGTEMPYEWAPCPECGWKAPDSWEMDEDISPAKTASSGLLSKLVVSAQSESNPHRPWISWTAWILLGLLCLGLGLTAWRH